MGKANVTGKPPAAVVFKDNPSREPSIEELNDPDSFYAPRQLPLSNFYICSRGRADNSTTGDLLDRHGIHNWYYVVDAFEEEAYRAVYGDRVLVAPPEYSEPFDPITNPKGTEFLDSFRNYPDVDSFLERHGMKDLEDWEQEARIELYMKDKPGTPASKRNYAHDHSLEVLGHDWHWILDDDLLYFGKEGHGRNKMLPSDFNIAEVLGYFEEFCNGIDGLGVSELDNFGLSFNREKNADVLYNVKCYTFMRIKNGTGIRWAGRFNDDVLLCESFLNRGYKTLSSKAITCLTRDTQVHGGGLTDLYKSEGTLKKSMMVPKVNPLPSDIMIRYGRIHHLTDWASWKQGRL